jgi:hypothetical protein
VKRGTRNKSLFSLLSAVPLAVPSAEPVPGAAEHSGPGLWGVLCVAVVVVGPPLWYALGCWHNPFRDCWWCKGAGWHRSSDDRRNSGPCWWCKGAGKRLRHGRRLYNAIQRRRKAAQ